MNEGSWDMLSPKKYTLQNKGSENLALSHVGQKGPRVWGPGQVLRCEEDRDKLEGVLQLKCKHGVC